jgi:hypothetical protein
MSELTELHRAVGRIEGKIDTFIEQMKVGDDRHGKLETRVRSVEGRIHWYSGLAAAVGALVGFGGAHGVKF